MKMESERKGQMLYPEAEQSCELGPAKKARVLILNCYCERMSSALLGIIPTIGGTCKYSENLFLETFCSTIWRNNFVDLDGVL